MRTRFEPTPLGLPSAWALWWFPLAVVAAFALLVALDLNGSSSGQEYNWFNGGTDPDALTGSSRAVRSDEWFVQLSWTISQFHQGFPAVNPSLPGGTDLTALYDVPTSYWTVAFRPQLWGYFVLGLSHGLAWHWWLPSALTAIAAYLLVITINPRRPLTAAALAVATVLTPMMLWWWQTSVFLSVGWALYAMTAMIWIVKDPRLGVRVWWIASSGFLAANLALTSYVPFIVSAVWVFVLFAVGVLVQALRDGVDPPRVILRRVAGFAMAGAAAGVVLVTWARMRADTLAAVVGTVYPGARAEPTGALLSDDPLPLFAAPFDGALRTIEGASGLGANQSESSTSFMVAFFLVPGLIVLTVAARRLTGRWSWTSLSVLAATALYLAYLFIANWDFGARLLFLDKMPAVRARLAFAALLPVSAAVTIQLADRLPRRPRWIAAALTGVTAVVCNGLVWLNLRGGTPNVLDASHAWRVAVVLLCFGSMALFLRRLVLPAALALMVAAASVSVGIIPVQRGVIDLYDSAPGRAVRAVDGDAEGTWVGTQFPVTTAVLVQSGVRSLNAVQSYPSSELWEAIDPGSDREENWNRIAHLDWQLGTTGETREELVAPDHLIITMDPCSRFAQDEVDYVLAPSQTAPPSDCLEPVRTIDTPSIDLEVLRIVPAS